MMKRIMITIAIFATMSLTGCSLNNELSPFIPVEAAGNKSSMTSTVSEVEEPTTSTSEVENESSTNISEPVASTSTASSVESKPEEKPVESTSTTTEKPVASTTTSSKVEKPVASSSSISSKPASSSTSSKVEKPVASSSTSSTTSKPVEKPVASSSSTSTTTSKPVEKPVEKVHNCSTDGHIWEVTTTTTEPKWCREMHMVLDYGLDLDLASEYLGVNAGEAYKIYKNTMKEIGISGNCGSGTIEVEVWGTETYETKVCTICGHIVNASDKGTITPIGEWQFVNGINRRLQATGCDFNTLFYDPYNVPQVVIDNIRIYRNR